MGSITGMISFNLEPFIYFVLGIVVALLIFYKATYDQRRMFNKLPAEIITPILADKRSRLSEEDVIKLLKYVESFKVEDWSFSSDGYYTKTILGFDHGKGAAPHISVSETVDGKDVKCDAAQVVDPRTGDVVIKVPADPDCRFAGKVSIG